MDARMKSEKKDDYDRQPEDVPACWHLKTPTIACDMASLLGVPVK